jgi:hypothetical protein
LLAEHFLREIEAKEKAGVQRWDPKAVDLLRAHVWPETSGSFGTSFIALTSSPRAVRSMPERFEGYPGQPREEYEPKKKARPPRRTASRAARR